MTTTLFLWVLPGRTPPEGYVDTGVTSVWPHTGKVRARLFERTEP